MRMRYQVVKMLHACNYNENATDDDSSCVFATGCETCSGETDGTGTVVDNDSDDDGVCDADEIAGCQDANACNYNASATDDDGSCVLLDGICETCSEDGLSVVDNDSDDDGVCDADEVVGCTDIQPVIMIFQQLIQTTHYVLIKVLIIMMRMVTV